MKSNNNQIDNTSYYKLPCGKQLEDFIWERHLDFSLGSALKYYYRCGKKDNESSFKDLKKCEHFLRFSSNKTGKSYDEVELNLIKLYWDALSWDGKDE